MSIQRSAGVYYEVHGRGHPLILGYPIMASTMPEEPTGTVLKGYLERLTDRYRVLVMDYPDMGPKVGRSRRIHSAELTAERVCSDLLAVADSAGFDRFAWWGFSWGGVIGLQLASRTDRVTALVCGGWPPLGGPYADLLRAAQNVAANPPPNLLIPPEQYVTFYQSVQDWPEADVVRGIKCPKMAFVGTEDQVEVGGVIVRPGATIHERRGELEDQGWQVSEIAGRDHSVYLDPAEAVPIVRRFLDHVV